jgi:biotin operon repressor
MPTSEDERRLRRLAIGAGMYPSEVPGYVQAGQLALYNRPDGFSLTTAEGVARFHAAVKASGARLVIVDSLLAAFGGADLNDNSAVRKLVSAAFLPLTSRDVAVLALHHRRKGSGGSKTPESERDAVLGAQAFGAAAGRVYSLERLDAAADRQGAFKLRLSLVGSWSPEDARDIVLQVADTEDGGTIVRQLDDAEQLRQGGIDEAQRAALRVTQLVRLRTRMAQKDALDEVATDLGCTRRTVEKGLAQAKARGWVSSVQVRGRALDLVPGSTAEEE